jgi:hypothetical protein
MRFVRLRRRKKAVSEKGGQERAWGSSEDAPALLRFEFAGVLLMLCRDFADLAETAGKSSTTRRSCQDFGSRRGEENGSVLVLLRLQRLDLRERLLSRSLELVEPFPGQHQSLEISRGQKNKEKDGTNPCAFIVACSASCFFNRSWISLIDVSVPWTCVSRRPITFSQRRFSVSSEVFASSRCSCDWGEEESASVTRGDESTALLSTWRCEAG